MHTHKCVSYILIDQSKLFIYVFLLIIVSIQIENDVGGNLATENLCELIENSYSDDYSQSLHNIESSSFAFDFGGDKGTESTTITQEKKSDEDCVSLSTKIEYMKIKIFRLFIVYILLFDQENKRQKITDEDRDKSNEKFGHFEVDKHSTTKSEKWTDLLAVDEDTAVEVDEFDGDLQTLEHTIEGILFLYISSMVYIT